MCTHSWPSYNEVVSRQKVETCDDLLLTLWEQGFKIHQIRKTNNKILYASEGGGSALQKAMKMFKSTFWLSDLISVKFYKLGAVEFTMKSQFKGKIEFQTDYGNGFFSVVNSFIFIFMCWIAQQQILYNAKYQTVNNWRQCGR